MLCSYQLNDTQIEINSLAGLARGYLLGEAMRSIDLTLNKRYSDFVFPLVLIGSSTLAVLGKG